MSSTPLKDDWNKRINIFNKEKRFTDISQLEKGDMVALPLKSLAGIVKSIGRKNIVIYTPYGGWGDSDYIQISEIKVEKIYVEQFIKPNK